MSLMKTNTPGPLVKTDTPTRRAFSERMKEVGAREREFIVMDADIGASTYANLFAEAFPERYFNMGIAELGMVSAAAGAACEGRTVVVSSYGVFLTMRAVESMRSYICYPNLNVKFLSSHGGLTAAIDGVSHQATEDISTVTTLPNMKVLVPADPVSAAAAFDLALATPGPVFVRLMRDPFFDLYPEGETFSMGGSKRLREGRDVTIVAYGDMVFQALEAAEELAREGLSAEVLDMYSLKPWDSAGLLRSVERTGAVVVVENHQKRNGLGYELSNYLLKNFPVPFENLGLADTFAESGDYYKVIDKYGIAARHVAAAVRDLLSRKGKQGWSRARSLPVS